MIRSSRIVGPRLLYADPIMTHVSLDVRLAGSVCEAVLLCLKPETEAPSVLTGPLALYGAAMSLTRGAGQVCND